MLPWFVFRPSTAWTCRGPPVRPELQQTKVPETLYRMGWLLNRFATDFDMPNVMHFFNNYGYRLVKGPGFSKVQQYALTTYPAEVEEGTCGRWSETVCEGAERRQPRSISPLRGSRRTIRLPDLLAVL